MPLGGTLAVRATIFMLATGTCTEVTLLRRPKRVRTAVCGSGTSRSAARGLCGVNGCEPRVPMVPLEVTAAMVPRVPGSSSGSRASTGVVRKGTDGPQLDAAAQTRSARRATRRRAARPAELSSWKETHYVGDMMRKVSPEGLTGWMFRVQSVGLGEVVHGPLRYRLLAPTRNYVFGVAVEEVPWGGRNLALAVAASFVRPFHPWIPVDVAGSTRARRPLCLPQSSPCIRGIRREVCARRQAMPRRWELTHLGRAASAAGTILAPGTRRLGAQARSAPRPMSRARSA